MRTKDEHFDSLKRPKPNVRIGGEAVARGDLAGIEPGPHYREVDAGLADWAPEAAT